MCVCLILLHSGEVSENTSCIKSTKIYVSKLGGSILVLFSHGSVCGSSAFQVLLGLSSAEVHGALIGSPDGARDGGAEASFFEVIQRFSRSSAG